MILALEEDQVLYVYDSTAEAVFEVEALDAEQTFRKIFDEQAQPYAIEWIRPNKLSRFTAENGEYRIVPRGSPDPGGLLAAIQAAAAVDPHDREGFVRELERRLISGL